MHKLLLIANFSKTLKEWNNSLNSFISQCMDNAFLGGLIVIVLFAFGCWAISYFTKK